MIEEILVSYLGMVMKGVRVIYYCTLVIMRMIIGGDSVRGLVL